MDKGIASVIKLISTPCISLNLSQFYFGIKLYRFATERILVLYSDCLGSNIYEIRTFLVAAMFLYNCYPSEGCPAHPKRVDLSLVIAIRLTRNNY